MKTDCVTEYYEAFVSHTCCPLWWLEVISGIVSRFAGNQQYICVFICHAIQDQQNIFIAAKYSGAEEAPEKNFGEKTEYVTISSEFGQELQAS